MRVGGTLTRGYIGSCEVALLNAFGTASGISQYSFPDLIKYMNETELAT